MAAASAKQKSQSKILAKFTVSVASFSPLIYAFGMKDYSQKPGSNIPVKAAPFGRWTLRDKAPRSAPYL